MAGGGVFYFEVLFTIISLEMIVQSHMGVSILPSELARKHNKPLADFLPGSQISANIPKMPTPPLLLMAHADDTLISLCQEV